MRRLSGFLILLIPALVFAAEPPADHPCGSVRLDEQGRSMEHVTPISQTVEDTGTCYAFSATQVFDAWRFSHGPRLADSELQRRASPLAAAATTSTADHQRNSTKSGRPFVALQRLIEEGACEHTALFEGATHSGKSKDLGVSESALIKRLEKAYKDFESGLLAHPYFPDIPGINSDPIMDRILLEHASPSFHDDVVVKVRRLAAAENAAQLSCKLQREPELFGDAWAANVSQLNTAVSASLYDAEDPVSFVDNLIKRLCSGHMLKITERAPTAVQKVLNTASEAKAALAILHSRLSQPNPQPVIMTACSKFFSEGNPDDPLKSALNRSVDIDGVSHVACRAEKDINHAVVVMGRRWNQYLNRCELLIQNTWGSDCSQYKKSSWNCESGRLWIEDRAVLSNAFEMDYLE